MTNSCKDLALQEFVFLGKQSRNMEYMRQKRIDPAEPFVRQAKSTSHSEEPWLKFCTFKSLIEKVNRRLSCMGNSNIISNNMTASLSMAKFVELLIKRLYSTRTIYDIYGDKVIA